ncbi:MAG: hypothetical protein ABSG74_13335 [Candidatus Bathyarchaeia archaeon]
MTKYCDSCGRQVADADRFCDLCGRELPQVVKTQTVPAEEQRQPAASSTSVANAPTETTTGPDERFPLWQNIAAILFTLIGACTMLGAFITSVATDTYLIAGFVILLFAIVLWRINLRELIEEFEQVLP